VVAQRSKPLAKTGTEEAIVTNLNKSPGEDVLQEAAHELLGRQGAAFEFAGVSGAVAKGDLAVGQFENALVADSDTKDVGCQVR
jgi:hypothetical protein